MIYADLTELWHSKCEDLLFGTRDEVVTVGQHVLQYDLRLEADTMGFELDVSRDLWMTKSRFTVLQNDYLDPDLFTEFVEKAGKLPAKRSAIAQMMCRPKGQRHVSFKWGNCILGFTYRVLPEPTFVMHSRISNITRLGGLDLALAYHVCSGVAVPEETRFVWHVDCVMHSAMLTMPYWYSTGLWRHLYEDEDWHLDLPNRPGLRVMARTEAYFDRLDAEGRPGKHGTRRRIREQRRAFLNGGLKRPRVPLSSLNLDPVKERQ